MPKFHYFLLLVCGYGMLATSVEPIKVLIGSPVRKQPAILTEFLSSLARLKHADHITVDYYFVDDNDAAASSDLLQEFARQCNSVCHIYRASPSEEQYICNENNHCWTLSLVARVAGFKNRIIQYALDAGYDYLFLVDSDLVLHSRTLEYLMAAHKDIIAENHWTKWGAGHPKQPSVWQSHDYHYTHTFARALKVPGVYPVGGLCACTLISKKALQLGVNFNKMPGVEYPGEDRHFCARAQSLGLELFADTHVPPYHIYRDSELAGVARYIRHHDRDVVVKCSVLEESVM